MPPFWQPRALRLCLPAAFLLAAAAKDTAAKDHGAAGSLPAALGEGEGRFPQDAALIFDQVWLKLVLRAGSEEDLSFPKEIIWLNGAPGAGKSTNTNFIRTERSIRAEPLVVSSLLLRPDMLAIKARGGLVGDKQVTFLVLEALMDARYRAGVIVDGYPRTHLQAEICKIVHERLLSLHSAHKESFHADRFLRPIFRIVVLYVDEPTAVSRQLKRGHEAEAHNARVADTGVGEVEEVRDTDKDEHLARKRYKIFIDKTYDALKSLGTLFIFNLINAGGSLDSVRQNIEREMEYQSSIELNPDTFEVVAQLELASDITMNARQRLVRRMDDYATKTPEEFRHVAQVLKTDVYPVIRMHAISGRCSHVSHNTVFLDDWRLQMAIDILSERGFRVTSEPVVQGVKLDVAWRPPEKLGDKRLGSRAGWARRGDPLASNIVPRAPPRAPAHRHVDVSEL